MKQQKKTNSNQSSARDGKWTGEEHQQFLEGLKLFGKNWKLMEQIITTRNGSQIRSHAQKYFNKIDRHRQLVWNPDNYSDSPNTTGNSLIVCITVGYYFICLITIKGVSPLRQTRTRVFQAPNEQFKKSNKIGIRISQQSFPKVTSNKDGNQDSDTSFWVQYIQPLLGNPECKHNFLRITTVLQDCKSEFKEINQQGKGRKDSFCTVGIHQDETATDRNGEAVPQ